MIIGERNVVPGRIILDQAVELLYLRPGVTQLLAPAYGAGRAKGAENRFDAVGAGKFHHRHDIAEAVLDRYITVVACNIVGAYEECHVFRMQVDYVRPDAR